MLGEGEPAGAGGRIYNGIQKIGGDRYAHCPDYGDNFTGVYMRQNLLNCIF